MSHPRVHLVLLNWNSAGDTLECLESVMRIDYPNYQVIVCENASSDDSVARLRDWAGGCGAAQATADDLQFLMAAPRSDPCSFVEMDRATAERGGTEESRSARMVLVHNADNLGFAGATTWGCASRSRRGHPVKKRSSASSTTTPSCRAIGCRE